MPSPRPAARPVELLAPAGGLEAGLAALQYGADAVYLGLKRYSARADAQNFTLDELDRLSERHAFVDDGRFPHLCAIHFGCVIYVDHCVHNPLAYVDIVGQPHAVTTGTGNLQRPS